MGCDIHMFVEYREKKSTDNWRGFGGRINPGRNYFMFGILAGVRMETDFSFTPKGMPDNPAYDAKYKNLLYISDSGDEGCTTLASAEKWVLSGISKFENNHEGKPTWVTHPDWHSHSWLTTNEFEHAVIFYRQNSKDTEPEYEALLSVMKRFEEMEYDCRVVFWFDN